MEKGNTEEVKEPEEIPTPDLLGKSFKEVEKLLKENELECIIELETEEIDKENTYVKEQTPNAGIIVNKGSKIYIK